MEVKRLNALLKAARKCVVETVRSPTFLNESFITVGILLGRWLELWIAVGTLACSLN